MELSNTKFGIVRKLKIEGFARFTVLGKFAELLFIVQLVDETGKLLSDKSLVQNREVSYMLYNSNFVNDQFDQVDKNSEGAKPEFDYFFQLMQTTALPTLITQLADKLIIRGIFN